MHPSVCEQAARPIIFRNAMDSGFTRPAPPTSNSVSELCELGNID